MPANESNLETLLAAAVEIADESQRDAYIQRACAGQAEQLAELRSMVHDYFAAGSLFDRPVVLMPTIDFSPPLTPATQIGPYKLLEQIGEGGMGVVYMAEQSEPIRRKVALKVIKPGMDTRQVVARFEAERQALALMDHPNIARVIDGGTTDAGRPYFVMELVRGIPITNYCDKKQLNTRQRLELFVTVCRAVQHAHQRAIIHRDLKPTNILVTQIDAAPVAKVIDFGVAKTLGEQLTDKTLFTQFSQMIGTPRYMSPEQAEMSGQDIDTRTDVYSLGVVLYELLTGSTPFDKETLQQASYGELLRIIREVEPPRPSVRVSTLKAEQLTTVSGQLGFDFRRYSHSLQGELDWIVMRSLEKDRTRRYESAAAFAEDVERFLRNETVQACPPSTAYRLKKLARRHRGALTTACLLGMTLLGGTSVSIWQAFEANAARTIADERFVLANQRLNSEQQARQEAEQQRRLAETNFAKALQAVDRLLTRVGAESLQDVPQMEQIQRQILQDAVTFYEGFLAERSRDPKVRYETAMGHLRIGFIHAKFGQTAEESQAFRRANQLLLALHAEQPDDLQTRINLALSHASLGWSRGTAPLERERHHRRSGELLTPVAESPGVANRLADSYLGLGVSLQYLDRMNEAEQAFGTAIALCHNQTVTNPNVLPNTYRSLALLLERVGRIPEALNAMEQGFQLKEQLSKEHSKVAVYRVELVRDSRDLGKLLMRANRHEDAVSRFQQGVEVGENLVREFPSVPRYRDELNATRAALVAACVEFSKPDTIRKIVEQLDPHTAVEYLGRASLHNALHDLKAALADYEKAIELEPDNWRCRFEIASFLFWAHDRQVLNRAQGFVHARYAAKLEPKNPRSWALLGDGYRADGNDSESGKYFQKALELDPLDPMGLVWLARDQRARGQLEAALATTDKLLAISTEDHRTWVARGEVHDSLKQYDKSLADYNKAIELMPSADHVYRRRAVAHFHLGHDTEALADIVTAVELNPNNTFNLIWISPKLVAQRPDTTVFDGLLKIADQSVERNNGSADAYFCRGTFWAAYKHYDTALADLNKAIELSPNDKTIVKSRANLYAEQKLWPQAAADYADVIKVQKSHDTYYRHALALLAAGDSAAYRAAVVAMLDAFGESTVSVELSFSAWTAALAPDTVEDYSLSLKLADRAVEAAPDNHSYQQSRGAVLFRAGRYEEALAVLQAVVESEKQTPATYSWYFLAMTQHKLAQRENARESFDKAVAESEKELAGSPENPAIVPWNRRLTLELLRAECAQLLGVKVEPQ